MTSQTRDTIELLKIAEWHLAELQATAELGGAAIATTYQKWRLRAAELRQILEGGGQEVPVPVPRRTRQAHAGVTTPPDNRR